MAIASAFHWIDSFRWCRDNGHECSDELAERMAEHLRDSFDPELDYWKNFQKAYDECKGGDHADTDRS